MKITRLSVWGLLESLDRCLTVFWQTLTGASKPLVISAGETAIRVDSPRFSQRTAFSPVDSTDGYLMFTENGLKRRMTLTKSVTTVGPSEGMDCRLADSGEDYLKFEKQDKRYYVNYVKERDSEGGACLNGKRLPADVPKELKPLDKIQLAHTTFIFVLPDASMERSKEAEKL